MHVSQVLAMNDLVKAAVSEAEAFGKQSKADVPARVHLGRQAQASQQVNACIYEHAYDQRLLTHKAVCCATHAVRASKQIALTRTSNGQMSMKLQCLLADLTAVECHEDTSQGAALT